MPFAVKPKQTLLFIGDSITDCGRRGIDAPLGNGYARLIDALIQWKYPAHKLNIINKGIGGNTIRDMMNRWDDDCLKFKPTWLSVKIGINDLHCYLRNVPDRCVTPDEFADMYDHILSRVTRQTKAKLVLVDPFFISDERDPRSFRHEVLKLMPKYLRTVEKMARKYKARHVRLHAMFQQQLKHRPADWFASEPVHPYPNSGHMLMAMQWLKAMGW